MKILVCIKQVPATTEVRLDQDHSLIRDSTSQMMNPADASALECALSLRNEAGAHVTVMTMGKPVAEGMLQEMVARGADRSILLTDSAFGGADTLATAKTLCAAIKKSGPYDLILCGRRALDGETGQVGPALAAMLDIPVVTNVTALRLERNSVCCTQLVENGAMLWRASMPLLVTFCDWSLALRLPTIAGMRRAKEVETLRWGMNDLGLTREMCGLRGSPTRVLRVHTSPSGLRQCAFTTVEDLFAEEVIG